MELALFFCKKGGKFLAINLEHVCCVEERVYSHSKQQHLVISLVDGKAIDLDDQDVMSEFITHLGKFHKEKARG